MNVRTFGSSTSISVAFVNSTLNQKDGEERKKRAHETAIIVKDHYSDIKNVSQIVIGFMKVETRFLVVTTSAGIDHYTFDNKANPIVGDGSTALIEDDSNPTPVYAESTNETMITSRYLLAGVPSRGLTMVSSMKVVGDTSKETPKAPTDVSFDFASFSPEQEFAGETVIQFHGDAKLVFEGKSEFSKGPGTDGMINQFAYLTMPFAKFRQLALSKKVTVSLADKNFDLTESQVESLRKMAQYVK